MRIARAWVSACATLLTAIGLLAAPAAGATFWIGGEGDWDLSENWDPGVPGAGEDVYLQQPGAHTVNYLSSSNPILNLVQIDEGTWLYQDQDDLTTRTMRVGAVGEGYYDQSGGAITIGAAGTNGVLRIGDEPGSQGYYTQANGTTTIAAAQDGQANLVLGSGEGSVGVYQLGDVELPGSDPQLIKQDNEEFIGDNGAGYFYHYSGSHVFSGAMYLAAGSGYGRYEMYGGTLRNPEGGSGGICLGEWGGTGEFYHESGQVSVYDLTLARQNDSTGNYTLVGDASLVLSGPTTVGVGGAGTFDHAADARHETAELVVGAGDHFVTPPGRSGTGTYELHGGGELIVAEATRIGRYGGIGSFFQYGGSTFETGELVVGAETKDDGTAGSASYFLAEGATLTVLGDESIGAATPGTFDQYDPDTLHTVHGNLWIDGDEDGKGVLRLYDGTLQVHRTAFVGNRAGSTGELNQFGGAITIDEDLVVGLWADGNGVVSLTGGTLTAGGIQVGYMGDGTLSLSQGAHLTTPWSELASYPGSAGNVVLTNDGSGADTVWDAGGEMGIGGLIPGDGGVGTLDLIGAENHLRIVNAAHDAGVLRIGPGSELRMSGGNGRVSVGSDLLGEPGTLWIAPGGILDMFRGTVSADRIEVSDGGQLLGSGVLDAAEVNVAGLLSPGDSPGLLELADDSALLLESTAVCEMDIAGTSGGQYDLLRAGGASVVHFDGLLLLTFSGSFSPGDLVTLFDFAGFEADFAGVLIEGLAPTLEAQFNALTGQVAIVAGPPAPGDADGNGYVDDNDLSLLLANWGLDTDWAHGEFSGAPPVGDDDLSLLLANWTGSPAAVAVPEPVGLALLAVGGLALLRPRTCPPYLLAHPM